MLNYVINIILMNIYLKKNFFYYVPNAVKSDNRLLYFLDIPSKSQPDPDEDYKSEDDQPLSSFASGNISSTAFSDSNIPITEPKWKKNFRMETPVSMQEMKAYQVILLN